MAGIQAAAIPDQGHRKNPQRFKSETTAQYGRLERAAGGAYEVAKDGDVGTVDTDAAGVHRETEFFGLFEIDTGIVEFGQAKTLRGQHAIQARGINRTGRAMTAPGASCYLVELLPIAFLPGGHGDHGWCRAVGQCYFPLR